MKIGIVGSGNVAQALSKAWAAKGHEVLVGSRSPQKVASTEWLQAQQNIQTGSLEQTAQWGDVVLLAINPWTEIKNVLELLAHDLRGKVVIDVSNNIAFGDQPKLAFTDKSMGEYVQQLLPDAYVVKTLNITPAPMVVNPMQSGIDPAIGWVSGDNLDAKRTVTGLLNDLGWEEVFDLGGIHSAKLQENIGLILTLVISSLRG